MHFPLKPVFLVLTIAVAGGARAQSPASDSAAAVATVQRFHAALAAGDSTAALSLLSSGVQIVESGGVENLAHYREHHLPADIAHARSTRSEQSVVQVMVRGDVAWVVSTSVTTGDMNGRAINSNGAELAVLARTPQGWTLSAVHWSSRARRSP